MLLILGQRPFKSPTVLIWHLIFFYRLELHHGVLDVVTVMYPESMQMYLLHYATLIMPLDVSQAQYINIWTVSLWMKVLVAKLGKRDYECSDVSLGLRRFYYNSCSINRFFINVSCSNILKRLLQQRYKFSPHLNFVKVHDRMRPASSAKVV